MTVGRATVRSAIFENVSTSVPASSCAIVMASRPPQGWRRECTTVSVAVLGRGPKQLGLGPGETPLLKNVWVSPAPSKQVYVNMRSSEPGSVAMTRMWISTPTQPSLRSWKQPETSSHRDGSQVRDHRRPGQHLRGHRCEFWATRFSRQNFTARWFRQSGLASASCLYPNSQNSIRMRPHLGVVRSRPPTDCGESIKLNVCDWEAVGRLRRPRAFWVPAAFGESGGLIIYLLYSGFFAAWLLWLVGETSALLMIVFLFLFPGGALLGHRFGRLDGRQLVASIVHEGRVAWPLKSGPFWMRLTPRFIPVLAGFLLLVGAVLSPATLTGAWAIGGALGSLVFLGGFATARSYVRISWFMTYEGISGRAILALHRGALGFRVSSYCSAEAPVLRGMLIDGTPVSDEWPRRRRRLSS
jgi:hypothetical protein